MKKQTTILLLMLVINFYVIIPYLVIHINDLLQYYNFGGSILGLIFIVPDPVIFIYNTRVFKLLGKGTPIPTEPTKNFVSTGLYRYSRNPIYLAHILAFFGLFLLFGRILLLLYAVIVAFAFHLYVVYVEEPRLLNRFGRPYLRFLKKVPRWISFKY